MKKLKLTEIMHHCFLFFGLLLILQSACTKEGAVGPRGEAGEAGIAGADGATIFSGTAVPAATMGQVGDFYFRISNGDFYGPKTAAGWGNPTNLKGAAGSAGPTGPTGPAGSSGSKILNGTAVPTTTQGANGDYYFRNSTADFYGPKTATGWGTPINLKGIKGADGSRIFSGTTVPASTLGAIGDFYFRTTTSDFYGPKGPTGWGLPTNLKGATGATGATGPAGTPGSKIWNGTAVPAPTIGVVGDYYLQSNTANFYGPKTANGWGNPINLKANQTAVIYSDWITLGNFRSDSLYGSMEFPELEKDAELINNASIVVYAKEYSFDLVSVRGIFQLNYQSPTWGINIQYYIDSNRKAIFIKTSDYIKPDIRDAFRFRYVVIPGNTKATPQTPPPAFAFRDYARIKEFYNIPN